MQSESDLTRAAEAAEKAAVEKDLQNWELSAEKERAAAQFDQEEGKKRTEDLIKELVASRTSYVMKLTLGGMHKSPIINRIGFEEDKQKILDLVAAEKNQKLEEPKKAYLDEKAEVRKLEAAQQKEQQQTAEQVQPTLIHRQTQAQKNAQYAELREWANKAKEKWDKEQEAAKVQEVKQEIRQPMRMTNESIERSVKEAKAQLERSKEQGLDYGRGLEHEI
jgi:hypothetical protein